MSMFTAHARREMKRLRAEEGLSASEARRRVLSAAPDYDWRMLNFGTYTPTDKTITALRASVPPASQGLSAVVGSWSTGEPHAPLELGGGSASHLLVEGPPGMGKTVLLAGIAESIAARYSSDEVVVVYSGDAPLHEVGVWCCPTGDAGAAEHALADGRRVVWVIDDFPHLAVARPERVSRIARLVGTTGGRLNLVLGGQRIQHGSHPHGVGDVLDRMPSRSVLTFLDRGLALPNTGVGMDLADSREYLLGEIARLENSPFAHRTLRVAGRLRGDDLPAPAPTGKLYSR